MPLKAPNGREWHINTGIYAAYENLWFRRDGWAVIIHDSLVDVPFTGLSWPG